LGSRRQRGADASGDGELWAKVISHRSRYFVWRDQAGDDWRTGDEAELGMVGIIDAITSPHRKNIGREISISLLTIRKYGDATPSRPLSGTVSLLGSQCSAQIYIPSAPFWALPQLIRDRQTWICIGWVSMERASADVSNMFIGDVEDRSHLLELAGESLVAD
jgi:hypothetical protein